jgi:hypothetical protein
MAQDSCRRGSGFNGSKQVALVYLKKGFPSLNRDRIDKNIELDTEEQENRECAFLDLRAQIFNANFHLHKQVKIPPAQPLFFLSRLRPILLNETVFSSYFMYSCQRQLSRVHKACLECCV